MQLLLEQLLGTVVPIVGLIDNDQAITAIKKGYSKKLRALPRTHRVAVGVLKDCLLDAEMKYSVVHCPSEDNKADLFTKALNTEKFTLARDMIGMFRGCSLGIVISSQSCIILLI